MKAIIFFLLLLIPSLVFPQMTEFKLFPFTNQDVREAHPVVINPQKIMMTYALKDTLRYSISTDGGSSWLQPVDITITQGLVFYSALKTNSGRIIIVWTNTTRLFQIISDDDGLSWSTRQINFSSIHIRNLNLTQTEDNTIWLTFNRRTGINFLKSTDNGETWSNNVTLATGFKSFLSIVSTGTGRLIACFQDSIQGDNNIFLMSSTDYGNNWSSPISVASTNLSEEKPRLITTGLDTVYLIYQLLKPTPFNQIRQYDIHYLKTTDGGNTWLPSAQFTRFVDDDILSGAYKYNDRPFVSLFSKRYSGERNNQLYYGILGVTNDNSPPPSVFKVEYDIPNFNGDLTLRFFAFDDTTITSVKIVTSNLDTFYLYDDGMHNDYLAGDFIFGNIIDSIYLGFDNLIYVSNLKIPLSNRGILAYEFIKMTFRAIVFDVQGNSLNSPITIEFGPEGKFDGIPILFSGGFLLSGYNGSFLWTNGVVIDSRILDYLPGRVGSDPNNPKNKLYFLRKIDSPFGPSWQAWRDAVSLGAYFYDGDNDGIYNPVDKNGNGLWDANEDKPDILGEETIWCVYNDGVPPSERRFSDVPPQGIEIRQTVFASNKPQLNNTVFIRYSILNKGTVANLFDSVYFSVWTDPEIGNYTNDLVGSDTLLNSGFAYNDGSDNMYGSNPPAFFTTLLQGPWIFTGNPTDFAYNHRGQLLGKETFQYYKNLNISSFFHYISYSSYPAVPANRIEARYYMIGRDTRGRLVNPCSWNFGEVRGGVNCALVNPRFLYSGDPVTNYGWINTIRADQRMMLSVGPFQLHANNPIDIIVAYTVGRGSDHLNSITVARNLVNAVINEYNSNFGILTNVDDNSSVNILTNFVLYQNYPNPFNNSTKIKYQIAKTCDVSLKVYDLLGREVKILVNEKKKPGVYEVEFNGSALSSGVYFYKLTAGDYTQAKKFILLK